MIPRRETNGLLFVIIINPGASFIMNHTPLKPVCLSLLLLATAPAQSRDQYVPLFTIERSINANVVHYEAKVGKDGRLDLREPVVAYWIMAAEGGRRQALNFLERTRAYGFTTLAERIGESYKMSLVSDRNREIRVVDQNGVVHAEAIIAGAQAYLQRIFITARKSLLFDSAESAELFGTDIATGQPRYEKVQAPR
jgi:hypothetical protein